MIYSVPHAVDAVGILVKSEDIRKSKDMLIRALTDELAAEKVVARENIALLSVVGEGSAIRKVNQKLCSASRKFSAGYCGTLRQMRAISSSSALRTSLVSSAAIFSARSA